MDEKSSDRGLMGRLRVIQGRVWTRTGTTARQ